MAKVSEQKLKAESSQLLTASRVVSQVSCEPKSLLPKQMWRLKQKALYEALGVATPQVLLSCEDEGKIPSPNSGAVARRANLILMSEVTDGMADTKPVPQGTRGVPGRQTGTKASSSANHLRSRAKGSSLSVDSGAFAVSASKGIPKVFSREARAKALSSANHLRSKVADKAPQCAPLPSSSITKLALRSGAKGSSLSVDSGAYVASAPKGIPKVFSCEARGKALSSANHLCGDEKNRTSSYVQSKRVSELNHLSPAGSDLREFLTSKRKSESFRTSSSCCQQVGCQWVTVHSVHCQLRPIPATPPH